MRIAFVTPEFATEQPTGDGLGSYLNRITRSLLELEHEVHVFERRPILEEPLQTDLEGQMVGHVDADRLGHVIPIVAEISEITVDRPIVPILRGLAESVEIGPSH